MTPEDFSRRLQAFEMEYPGDAADALEKAAKQMVRALRRETPASDSRHPHKLNKSWRMKVKSLYGKAPEADIRSNAPHFHLVERGVQNPKDPHGNPKPEWVAALNRHRGFLERAVEGSWPEIREKMEKDFYRRVRERLG